MKMCFLALNGVFPFLQIDAKMVTQLSIMASACADRHCFVVGYVQCAQWVSLYDLSYIEHRTPCGC